MNEQRGTASHLQESTKKAALVFDLNQSNTPLTLSIEFLVESFAASLDDDSSPSKKMPGEGIVAQGFKSSTIKLQRVNLFTPVKDASLSSGLFDHQGSLDEEPRFQVDAFL